MTRATAIFLVSAIAFPLATAQAQSPVFPEERLPALIAGDLFPLTRKIEEVSDGTWRRFRLQGSDDFLVTHGETFRVGETLFLIAYRWPSPRQATGGTLELSLVNLRTIPSLNNIHPLDPARDLHTESARAPALKPRIATAPMAASLRHLTELGAAIQLYLQDYSGVLPPLQNVDDARQALRAYVKNDLFFISPIDRKPYQPNPALASRKIAHLATPGSFVLYFESSPAPDGTRGVVFANGLAKRIYEAEWPRLKQLSKIP